MILFRSDEPMKTCFRCGVQKPLSEFYPHPEMADGHLGKCRACTKEDVRANRVAKVAQYRQHDKVRSQQPERKRAIAESVRRYRAVHPDRNQAVNAVNNAVRDGHLLKPEHCEACGTSTSPLHGHHPDYTRPLQVVWLCPACHSRAHRNMTVCAQAAAAIDTVLHIKQRLEDPAEYLQAMFADQGNADELAEIADVVSRGCDDLLKHVEDVRGALLKAERLVRYGK